MNIPNGVNGASAKLCEILNYSIGLEVDYDILLTLRRIMTNFSSFC